jgi:hypothetical protein
MWLLRSTYIKHSTPVFSNYHSYLFMLYCSYDIGTAGSHFSACASLAGSRLFHQYGIWLLQLRLRGASINFDLHHTSANHQFHGGL